MHNYHQSSTLSGKNLESLDNNRQIINKKAAIRELEFNEQLFYSCLETFLQTSIDQIVQKVALALSYDYFQQGIDNLNGLIASCSFIQAHYLNDQSLQLRASMKKEKRSQILSDYQLWIETILYTKLQALKLLDEKNLSPYAKLDAQQMIKNMYLLEGYIIQSDLMSGHFYCLGPGETRAQRIDTLSYLNQDQHPGNAPDIKWMLELNKYKPVTFKRSIAEMKQDEFDSFMQLNGSTAIEMDEGRGIACGCNMGRTCNIF